MALRAFGVLGVFAGVAAFPDRLRPGSCRAWVAGESGYMGAGTLSDGAATNGDAQPFCEISVSGDLIASQAFTVTVTAPVASLMKLYSSDGQCLNPDSAHSSGADREVSKDFTWTAPASVPSEGITFSALCSAGFSATMHAAAARQLCPPTGCEESPRTTEEPTAGSTTPVAATTTSRTEGTGSAFEVATVTDLELVGGLFLSFRPATVDDAEPGVEITVTFSSAVWIGFGFSAGSGVSMTGDGIGADIYVCTDGDVRRHFVSTRSISGSGEEVPESVCSQEGGRATMTFTRSLAPNGRRLEGREVTPGREQQVIWAYASGRQTGLSYHGGNRGGLFIDFATGATGEISLEGQASLYIHLVLMILAWGFFLPSGVALGKCLRRAPNGNAGGVWFSLHWKFQAFGSLLTLLGLAAAIWYAEDHSTHFNHAHSIIGIVVCALAALQVLGGACRPHKQEIITAARRAFELGHKGLGYAAVLLGALNIVLGIVLVYDLEFETAVTALATVLAAIFMFPVLAYVAVSAVMPDNALSRMLLGVSRNIRQEERDGKTGGAGQ